MNWIEHLEAAANSFHSEAKDHLGRGSEALAKAATKDAKAIEKLIEDIENGVTQNEVV